MIQAPLTKPIETKAPVRAESVSNSKAPKAKKEVEASSESNEFAKELEASSTEKKTTEKNSEKKTETTETDSESKVKAIKISADQKIELPSALINQNGSVDTTSPKVFDPKMTKGVEDLIQPASAEVSPEAPVKLTDAKVLALANGNVEEAPEAELKADIAQAMLKNPQLADAQKQGRAPAIEFAQAEIDPQLMNNEDFVLQKNQAAKKAMPNAYGIKAVPAQQAQKLALESGLKQTQVVKEASAVDGSPVNSQQFILNIMNDQKQAPQLNDVQAAPKVFDMSNIKSSNTNEVISQITDYVVQAKAAKEPTVNMRVNHEELGLIDITVSRVAGVNADAIAINIGAHTLDGKNFFQQNSKDLFSHMAQAGINVTDMKVETPNQTAKNDFDFGSQSGRNQQGSEKQFGSEQNQRRHESERRQDLWKLLNKEAA
jgi:hypothetical protein